jgi:hypothetical protein
MNKGVSVFISVSALCSTHEIDLIIEVYVLKGENMARFVKSLFVVLFLAGCAAPAATATAPVIISTATSLPPTEAPPAATSTPGISGVQVSIPVEQDNEMFNATVTGNGAVAVILGHAVNEAASLVPLVEALSNIKNVSIVTFAYRDVESTISEDTRAVFDYLRAEGQNRIICITYGFGQTCGALQNEPEIVGMVFYDSIYIPVMEADFPKLFLASDPGSPFVSVGQVQLEYDRAAEPKIFKTYESGRFGLGVFTDPKAGPQLMADIADFIHDIVSGQ